MFSWGNSIFSFQGMPLAQYGNDTYGLGIGNTGLGDLFRIGTNYHNPAMLVSANKVFFSTSVRFGYLWYLEKDGKGFRDNELHFPNFTIAVPVFKHRFGLMYSPYLNGNIKNEKESIFTDSEDNSYVYHEIHRLSNTVNKISVLYAYRHDFINFGLSFNYFLGHQIHFWEMNFDNTSLSSAKYEKENTFKNAGFTIGLAKKFETFSFGLSYQSSSLLKGNSIWRYNFTPGTDTLLVNETLFKTPELISFGYAQKLPKNFKFNSEFHYEFWQKSDFYERDSYKVGFGLSYDPISGYGKWTERIPLRIGGYYRVLPFEKENHLIEEKAITWGFTIPFVSPEKQVDFACEYILRGNADTHGVRDKILYFSIGINGFDIFSKQPKKTAPREIPRADF
jgi:hypothetical protein